MSEQAAQQSQSEEEGRARSGYGNESRLIKEADVKSLHHEITARAVECFQNPNYYQRQEIDGVEFLVSTGNEHFTDDYGALRDKPEIHGYRLMKKYKDKGGSIYVVKDGVTSDPAWRIDPAIKQIFLTSDIEALGDLKELAEAKRIVYAIKADCIDTQLEKERQAQVNRLYRKRRLKGAVNVVGSLALMAAVSVGIGKGVAKINEHSDLQTQQEQAQREAEQQRAEQEALEQQEAIQQQIEQREEEIREFDEANSIQSSSIRADEIEIIEASGQFDDIEVPQFGESDIDDELSLDISSPRSIPATFRESDLLEVDLTISESDRFRIVHNGSDDRAYAIVFNSLEDTVSIRNIGTIDGSPPSGPAATEFVIQQVN